ncbi:MAG: KOW domain-containing RNA-binding protein [Oscillospiraceae bacterium]|nr:KOW domain-containing RNA-binding protein [Oscillospiraceae bacterium]
MEFARAQIVCSLAGRDKGDLFCVMDTDGAYLLLADGKRRKAASPKRKKAKHASGLGMCNDPALEKLSRGEGVTNRALRRALAAFRAEAGRV